jgi:hypothetical protein
MPGSRPLSLRQHRPVAELGPACRRRALDTSSSSHFPPYSKGRRRCEEELRKGKGKTVDNTPPKLTLLQNSAVLSRTHARCGALSRHTTCNQESNKASYALYSARLARRGIAEPLAEPLHRASPPTAQAPLKRRSTSLGVHAQARLTFYFAVL